MKRIRLFFLVGLFIIASKATAQPVSIPAKVDVSAIGTATYAIPIEVVPGTNGLQPNLAVVYNSMSGLNVLGQKWGLQGISSITRVPQSVFFDGNISPVTYDTTDRYALDGNRMVLFSGSSYQSANAVYCFETEDFSRITKTGSASNYSFVQTLPDGSKVEYGRSSQCRLTVDNGKYLSWMVERVIDVNGNYMKYYYQQSDGEIWVSHIDYTILCDGTPAYASVIFEYETLTHPNDGYVSGHRVRQSKLLKNIVVKHQGSQVRKYSFAYDTDMANERLSSVTLYSSDNEFMTRTNIGWNTPPATMTTDESMSLLSGGSRAVAGNFDEDRIYDIFAVDNGNHPYVIRRTNNGSSFARTDISSPFPNIRFDNLTACDIDGDGVDEVVFRDTVSKIHYSIEITTSGLSTPSAVFPYNAGGLIWGDYDGDGILEPVAFSGNSNYISYKWFEGTNNGAATLSNYYDKCHAGDFDGDGKTDLLFLYGSNSDIYTYNIRTAAWTRIETDGFPNTYQYLVVGDFNGDGMSDLLFLPNNETNWKLAIRKGKNSWTLQIVSELDGTHEANNIHKPLYVPVVCDINGDGKSDILQPVANNTVRYIISDGCLNDVFQYSTYGGFSLANGQKLSERHFSIGDFDGNCITDILFFNPGNGGAAGSVKYFYKGNFPGYYVNRISDAYGKETRLEYSTISLMPNRYTGTGMNWMPMPLVKNLVVSDGLGGFDTTRFYYGHAQFDADKHQFIGFGLFGMKNNNKVSETFFSRVPSDNNATFAMMMPDSVVNYIVPAPVTLTYNPYFNGMAHLIPPVEDKLVSKTVNVNNSVFRTNVSGNVTFLPYTSVSTEYDYLKNTKDTRQVQLNNGNWRPVLQDTWSGYITGSTDEPVRQQTSTPPIPCRTGYQSSSRHGRSLATTTTFRLTILATTPWLTPIPHKDGP